MSTFVDLSSVPDEYRDDCARLNAMRAKTIELTELFREIHGRYVATGQGRLRMIRVAEDVVRQIDATTIAYSEFRGRLAKGMKARRP